MTHVVRRTLFVLLAVMVYGGVGAWLSSVVPAGARSDAADLQPTAEKAIEAFLAAIMTGESDQVAAVLAPPFQLIRTDGTVHTAETYPDSALPVIAEMPVIGNLTVTADGDLMVATYTLEAAETVDGATMATGAPRMTVFRKNGDDWAVVAHSNLSSLSK